MIGASLLWVGWFGFNAGSNLEANGVAALAFINTYRRDCCGGARLGADRADRARQAVAAGCGVGRRRRPRRDHSGVGLRRTGDLDRPRRRRLADLLLLRHEGEERARLRRHARRVRRALHRRDRRRARHRRSSPIPALGGQGWIDYTVLRPVAGKFDLGAQVISQLWAIGIDAGLVRRRLAGPVLRDRQDRSGCARRVEVEREGLDINEHGERAYNF